MATVGSGGNGDNGGGGRNNSSQLTNIFFFFCLFVSHPFWLKLVCVVCLLFGLFAAEFICIYAISCFSLSLALRLKCSVFTDFIVCLCDFRVDCSPRRRTPHPLHRMNVDRPLEIFRSIFFFKINYSKHAASTAMTNVIDDATHTHIDYDYYNNDAQCHSVSINHKCCDRLNGKCCCQN